MYIQSGLARYGYSQLRRLLNSRSGVVLIRTELKRLLETLVQTGDTEPSTHFHLGEILSDEKKFWEAVKQFQEASRAPELRSIAQQRAARCFSELRLNTAATSAWRQSRESHLDDNARSILFILARSFEDIGSWKEAAKSTRWYCLGMLTFGTRGKAGNGPSIQAEPCSSEGRANG